MSVFQMIDQQKYDEAKESIELATWNEKTARWHRTYYAKGLLCQTAYEDGYPKRDIKKTQLYPDQLFLAYESYEKARELDVRGRNTSNISQKYYHLSNDFRKLGSDLFRARQFEEALRAFEHALLVNHSDLVNAPVDTNLVYNTALAAYESKRWDKALTYLTGLHEAGHKPGTTLLLHNAYNQAGDSTRAEEVLMEALEIYDFDQQVAIYLVNLFANSGRMERAIEVLDLAIANHPEVVQFHWGRGLIYRRMAVYDKAIESFMTAIELKPDEAKLYYHLGVIYYNQGIDLREAALTIGENSSYRRMKAESRKLFQESVTWLEKAYELDPFDTKTIGRLRQLYVQLNMKEKEASLELLLE